VGGDVKKGLTEIAMVLDRSGSMEATADDAIGGFNGFLDDQKRQPGELLVTVVGFDNQYEIWRDRFPVAEVPPLTRQTFVPRGSTALLDAIGRTVDALGKRVEETPEEERPEHVVVVIITDGHENASTQYRVQDVFDKVRQYEQVHGWRFTFIGANQDAIATAARLGVDPGAAMSSAPGRRGTLGTYAAISRAVSAIRKDPGGWKAYTKEDRDEAAGGDSPAASSTDPKRKPN
jgi:uncharacterized protein YegL